MTDKPKNQKPNAKIVLGAIPEGPYDSQLQAGSSKLASKPERPKPMINHSKDAAPDSDSAETLTLPRGGLVAMRKSGGLKFSTQQVVIYRNGRVVANEDTTQGTKKLTDAQLAELYRVLDAANFSQLVATAGKQNPDAFAYEITARIGRNLRSIETSDGSIPESIEPLIRLLRQYM